MSLQGYFNEQHTPCLRFCIVGGNGKEYSIEGIIDTGFTGFVQIPLVTVVAIGLKNQP